MNIRKKSIIFITIFTLTTRAGAQNLVLFGLNESLNKRGIELSFNYTGEIFSNLSGGLGKKSVYLDNYDLILGMDLEQAIGWNGANLKMYILGNHGDMPSKYSGTIQGTSNIAVVHDSWKLYEFWLEQNLFDDKFSLLLGLYDLNSEFDTRETSSLFINPSHGIGADFSLSGQNGPSIFPTTSLALRARYHLSNHISIQAALFDGIPGDLDDPSGTKVSLDSNDGLLVTSEINVFSESKELDEDYFKFSIGSWYYTAEFDKILGTDSFGKPLTKRGNYGLYISGEKFLFAENENSTNGLAAFLRVGYANKELNQVDNYIGAGINYIGLFPGRDDDILGFAIAAAHHSEDYRTSIQSIDPKIQLSEYEFILELTYHLNIFDYLQIQPDVQYAINPSNVRNGKTAITVGTRMLLKL